MSSTKQTLVRVVSQGFDQSKQRHLTDPSTCWDLLNLRSVNGRLEQTPWLGEYVAVTHVGAPAYGDTTHLLRQVPNKAFDPKYLVVTDSIAKYVDVTTPATQSSLPVVRMVTRPNNTTLTGQCLLYGINSTDFAAYADTIEVNIDAATTFRWRRNGGAWSASLPIQQDTAIGANGLHVSFQGQGSTTDFTGYTVGNSWVWQYDYMRQPSFTAKNLYVSTRNYASDVYGNDIYFAGGGREVYRVRDNFVTSVGYCPTFGRHVAVFYGHLFVSQFSYATVNGVVEDSLQSDETKRIMPFTLGWSHLNNPDQFFSTLINEADSKPLVQQQFADNSWQGITGLAPWRSLLFVFLPTSIWTFQYVGLPNVFQGSQLNSGIGSVFMSGVVRTPQAIYFIGQNDFYKIDEFEPTPMGLKVRNKFFSEIAAEDTEQFQRTFGIYNPEAKEVVWTYWSPISGTSDYQARQVVYNEQTDDWHFRNMPCTYSGETEGYCSCPMYHAPGKVVYGYDGHLFVDLDQSPGATSPKKDTYNTDLIATAYTKPYFITPFLNYGDFFHIKQAETMYIDAHDYNNDGLILSIAARDLIGAGSPSYTALGQTWTRTLTDMRLSLPRTPYRSVSYKFEFQGSPLYYGIFNLYQEFILGPQLHVEK